MTDQRRFSPNTVLQKHLALNSQLTVAMSVNPDGSSVVDISTPAQVTDVLYLREILDHLIREMFLPMLNRSTSSQTAPELVDTIRFNS